MKAPKPKRVKQSRGDVWRYEYRNAAGQHKSWTYPYEGCDFTQACRLLWAELKRRDLPAAETLFEFMRSVWFPPRLARWSRKTQMEIASLFRTRIAPDPIAAMALDQIRKADVEAFLLRQAAAGRAQSSGRMTLWALRSAFAEAVENELIVKNPAARVQLPTMTGRVDTVPFDLEEVRRLVTIPEWEGLAIRALLFCGLRIGELAALRNSDIGELLTVDESTDGGGRYKSTKSRRVRYVPVPPQLLVELLEHTRAGEPDAPVFPDPVTGEMWNRTDELNERLRLCAAVVGVQAFTSRRCRTTCGTLLEADIADVRDHLGHADSAMTMKHYRRAISERHRLAVAELERVTMAKPVKLARKRRAG